LTRLPNFGLINKKKVMIYNPDTSNLYLTFKN